MPFWRLVRGVAFQMELGRLDAQRGSGFLAPPFLTIEYSHALAGSRPTRRSRRHLHAHRTLRVRALGSRSEPRNARDARRGPPHGETAGLLGPVRSGVPATLRSCPEAPIGRAGPSTPKYSEVTPKSKKSQQADRPIDCGEPHAARRPLPSRLLRYAPKLLRNTPKLLRSYSENL